MSDLGSMEVKVGADIRELLSKVDQAKAKLGQLIESQEGLKASAKKYTSALADNEKQISTVTAKLTLYNSLSSKNKDAIAATTTELTKYNIISNDIKGKLAQVNAAIATNTENIKTQSAAVRSLSKEHNAIGDAISKFTNFNELAAHSIKSFGREVLHVIPALAFGFVSGGISLAVAALVEFIAKIEDADNASKLFSETIGGAGGNYAKAIENVSRLREEISLAKQGFLNKDQVVKDYNETIGKTTGLVKTLDQAEQALNKNAEAYIKFTFLKAVANEANASAAKKSVEAELAKLKPLTEFADKGDVFLATLQNFLVNPLNDVTESMTNASIKLVKVADKNKKDIISAANGDAEALKLMAKKYGDEAAALAKKFNFNPFEDNKTDKKTPVRSIESIIDVLAKLERQIGVIKEQGKIDLTVNVPKESISAIESTIKTLVAKFKQTKDSEVIINLIARINDIQLREEFKKVLKGKVDPFQIPLEFIESNKSQADKIANAFKTQFEKKNKVDPPVVGLEFRPFVNITDIQDDIKKAQLALIGITKGLDKPGALDEVFNFQKPLEKLSKFSADVNGILNNLNVQIAETLGTALGDILSGGQDFFGGLFKSIFQTLGSVLIQLGKVAIETGLGIKAIKEAFKSLRPFVAIAAGIGLIALGTIIKNSVGKVGAFASGGHVTGPGTKTSDSIPAKLSAGEYIIKAATVDKFGVKFFDKINAGSLPFSTLKNTTTEKIIFQSISPKVQVLIHERIFHPLTQSFKDLIRTISKLQITTGSKYVSGGFVSGPGTKTSDSVLARLSRGEYVMSAMAVDKYGTGFFDRLNSGIYNQRFTNTENSNVYNRIMNSLPGFANGGFVGNDLVPQIAAGSIANSNSVIIPDVKIQGKDLVLVFNRAQTSINNNS